jgi:AraC-like DNA-binding protein
MSSLSRRHPDPATVIPDSIEPGAYAVGVAVEPLFASPIFRIGRWRCVVGMRESTAVQEQQWHMMSFTHRGAFVVHSGGRSAVIDSNCTLLVNPRSSYRMSRHFGHRSHGSYFLVRPDVVAEVALQAGSGVDCAGTGFAEIQGPSSTESYLLQRLILEHLAAGGETERLATEELALSLVESALGPGVPAGEETGPRISRRQRELIEHLKGMLAQSCDRSRHLDELAQAVGLSPFHLCRLFKRATATTLHRYQTSLRLRMAFDRVADRHCDLGELAYSLGFSSHSHFTAAFRKEFGAAPTKFRRLANSSSLRTLSRHIPV